MIVWPTANHLPDAFKPAYIFNTIRMFFSLTVSVESKDAIVMNFKAQEGTMADQNSQSWNLWI